MIDERIIVDTRLLVGEQTFVLPFPPSVNAIWRSVRGRVIKSPKYKAWQQEAGLRLNIQRPKHMPGLVRMSIKAVKPDRRRRDLGNIEKAISDLLVAHRVIEDDSCIQHTTLEWWISDNMTGVSVTLTSMLARGEAT